jgi:hypothetical protein
VFAAVLEHADRFDDSRAAGANAAPWLFAIARNTLSTSLRRGRVAADARRRVGMLEPLALDDEAFARIEAVGAGLSCWSTEQILAGKATSISMAMAPLTAAERAAIQKAAKEAHGKAFSVPGVRPRTTGDETVAGMVPDGVTAVEVGVGATSVRVPVADNFFVAHVRIDPDAPGTGGRLVRWFDAAGKDVTPG